VHPHWPIRSQHVTFNSDGHHCYQQYLSDVKNPYGYCNYGPSGLTCPVGIARTLEAAH